MNRKGIGRGRGKTKKIISLEQNPTPNDTEPSQDSQSHKKSESNKSMNSPETDEENGYSND
jgi:hypothetical protein